MTEAAAEMPPAALARIPNAYSPFIGERSETIRGLRRDNVFQVAALQLAGCDDFRTSL